MRTKGAQRGGADATVARIAKNQFGVVTRAQLTDAGLSSHAVAHRVQNGRLHRLHRSVYAVGHRHLTQHGLWLAATLACGAGGALSHGPAAALWRLRPLDTGPPDVSVVARHGRKRRPQIVLHRVRLDPADVTRRQAIPVTTPARTLIDIAPPCPLGGSSAPWTKPTTCA